MYTLSVRRAPEAYALSLRYREGILPVPSESQESFGNPTLGSGLWRRYTVKLSLSLSGYTPGELMAEYNFSEHPQYTVSHNLQLSLLFQYKTKNLKKKKLLMI